LQLECLVPVAAELRGITIKINKTVATNGLLIITFHHIIDDSQTQNYPEEYYISDFKSISDFLKIEQDAGKLDVVTMSKYFGTPTPTPNTYISHIKLANGFYKVDGQSNPSIINVTKGDSVQWINDGSNSVTLVSIENLWTNKTLKRNAKFSYRFNIIGKYHVYLSGYPNRNQTINVN
jgi:plastocyanin